MIIAAGHQSRVGKNTACEAIKAALVPMGVEVTITAFAKALKDIARDEHGAQEAQFYEEVPAERYVFRPEWGGSYIDLLIRLSKELKVKDPCFLLKKTVAEIGDHRGRLVLLSDLRFPQEMAWVKSEGGKCVKITRPGFPSISEIDRLLETVPSEQWDLHVDTQFQSVLEQEVVRFATLLLQEPL